MKNENNKSFIMMTKNNGKFYQTYNDDAYVISYLLGYKVLDNKKCGFPDNALNKVINKLEENKISYKIVNINKDMVIKDYKKLNNYNKYKEIVIKKLELDKRIELIIEKIKSVDKNKLEKIIENIELCLE